MAILLVVNEGIILESASESYINIKYARSELREFFHMQVKYFISKQFARWPSVINKYSGFFFLLNQWLVELAIYWPHIRKAKTTCIGLHANISY